VKTTSAHRTILDDIPAVKQGGASLRS